MTPATPPGRHRSIGSPIPTPRDSTSSRLTASGTISLTNVPPKFSVSQPMASRSIRFAAGENREWELAHLRVPDGRQLSVSPLDLPVAANLDGFSLHPDGKRFVFSMRVLNYDIWLLDGFDH